ncbi:MAG: hypothetical protein OXF04_05635 [bacterium]|nr:hypothetical protein [bacterium]
MTTRNFDILRLGVGLAHKVRGAELRLSTPSSPDLVASRHPTSDISICSVREAVLYSGCRHRSDMSRWISIIGIGGSLEPCGGGVYRLQGSDAEQRWFATLLSADEVIGVLNRLERGEPLSSGVDANLMPDLALGVTAVCLSTDDPFVDIGEVAVTLHSACLVSELLEQSDSRSPKPDLSSSNSSTAHSTSRTKENNR